MADVVTRSDSRRRRTRGPARYEEVADDLLHRIESGEFPPGSYLPIKQDLQAHYHISLATLDNAFGVLRDMKRIKTQQGRGTEVLAPPPPGTEDDGDLERLQELNQQVLTRLAGLTGEFRQLAERMARLEQREAEREAAASGPGS